MSRNHASAKKAGTFLERQAADYLAEHVDDRIDRRAKTGTRDKGDIGGLRHQGHRVVIEVKNTAKIALAGWAAEAEVERVNDGAIAGLVVHKRVGRAAAGDQWVTCTLRDLAALLTGTRPDDEVPT